MSNIFNYLYINFTHTHMIQTLVAVASRTVHYTSNEGSQSHFKQEGIRLIY